MNRAEAPITRDGPIRITEASGRTELLRGSKGSILLEVVVATMLVALLVVPLAEGLRSAVEQARTTRERSAAPSSPSALPSPDDDPWSWGARVTEAWWRPGPVLHLRVEMPGGEAVAATLSLGMWVDGWCIEEGRVISDRLVGVEQAVWQGRQGGELVVRVRSSRGGWGPPWRTQVPGSDGLLPAGSITGAGGESGRAWLGNDPAVVIHTAFLGTALPSARVAGEPVGSLPGAHPLLFPAAGIGWWTGQTEGRSQWWPMEPGRGLDVYF